MQLNTKPIIYLFEEQIYKHFSEQGNTPQKLEGMAFGCDEGTLFHAFMYPPKYHPRGFPCFCFFVFKESKSKFSSLKLEVNELLKSVIKKKNIGVVIIITKDEIGNLLYNAYIMRADELIDCIIYLVPRRTELFSRSKGLLETDILVKKSVGIIGLGSGGSLVAIELAKAGIGNFVLIDYDRIELSNISRHICGINDLGRYKTNAVCDAIWQKNPFADVKTFEINVNKSLKLFRHAVSDVDLIICASDNNQSRFNINSISLEHEISAIYGRAITRAAGGDVLRVRPFEGPCYNCLIAGGILKRKEELSQMRQVREIMPDYVDEDQANAMIQVGLSSDIAPISNMMVKLALVELSRGLSSGISSLEEDLVADYYIWANRREYIFFNWHKMGYKYDNNSILRWYGARIERDQNCLACGEKRDKFVRDNLY